MAPVAPMERPFVQDTAVRELPALRPDSHEPTDLWLNDFSESRGAGERGCGRSFGLRVGGEVCRDTLAGA